MTKALILAAGRGSRLEVLTEERPKCMVELKKKPLIDYQVKSLNKAGIQDVAVVCGYLKEKIQHSGLSHRFENPKWAVTNMVASLFAADEWLSHDVCVVSYGDIFYDPRTIVNLLAAKDDFCIAYDENFMDLWKRRFENPWDDLESFQLTEDHYLSEIGNTVQPGDLIQGQYMGLLKFTPQSWALIRKTISLDEINTLDMTSLLQRMIHVDMKIKAVPNVGVWGEVDNPQDLDLYESKQGLGTV